MPNDPLGVRVARLRLQPGDVLVVKADVKLDKDQIRALHDGAKHYAPNNKVLVLSNVDLNVRRSGEHSPDETLEWE